MTSSSEFPDLPASTALFLDFDGTLVSIAPRPQDVRVADWVVPTLTRLQQRLDGALAIVSGRPIAQIDAFLTPLVLAAAGAHGAERRNAAGRLDACVAEPPPQAERSARDLVREHTELIFEPKPSGFALHYRARPDLEALCRDTLAQALAASPDASSAPSGAARGWTLQQGHCVIEVKQAAVSKGTALQAFLSEAPFAGRVPVFVGDDVTDEDGIRVAQAAGGFGVRVGDGASQAHHRLRDTDAVARWLTGAAQAAAPHAEGAR